MNQQAEVRADAGSMRAELVAQGGAGRTIVYVPGIDGTGRFLFDLADRITERYQLIRLRYVSPLPAPEQGDTYEDLARTVAECIRHHAPGKVLLLAESFGGAVALQTALSHPELVEGLLIVNSFAHFHRRFGLALSCAAAPLLPQGLIQIGRRVFAQSHFFGRRRDAEAMRTFIELPGVRLDQGYRRRLNMIKRLDLLPQLGKIKVPVALYAADRDRIVDSPREAARMAEHLPDATVKILSGAGHLVLPLHDEPWMERIDALWGRVDA